MISTRNDQIGGFLRSNASRKKVVGSVHDSPIIPPEGRAKGKCNALDAKSSGVSV